MCQGDLFTLKCAEKMSVLSFLEFHKHPRLTDGGETYTVSLCYLSLLWFELSPFSLGIESVPGLTPQPSWVKLSLWDDLIPLDKCSVFPISTSPPPSPSQDGVWVYRRHLCLWSIGGVKQGEKRWWPPEPIMVFGWSPVGAVGLNFGSVWLASVED